MPELDASTGFFKGCGEVILDFRDQAGQVDPGLLHRVTPQVEEAQQVVEQDPHALAAGGHKRKVALAAV